MTSSKKPSKGWFYAAKFLGDNGDLILGRVKKTSKGEVFLINLLTKKESVKSIEILLRRNHRITKREADAIVEYYEYKQSKQEARAMASSMWKRKNR